MKNSVGGSPNFWEGPLRIPEGSKGSLGFQGIPWPTNFEKSRSRRFSRFCGIQWGFLRILCVFKKSIRVSIPPIEGKASSPISYFRNIHYAAIKIPFFAQSYLQDEGIPLTPKLERKSLLNTERWFWGPNR